MQELLSNVCRACFALMVCLKHSEVIMAHPLASREFEGFLEYLALDHKKGIPYWPQSYGEVERFNKTLMKTIRIAQLQDKDWKGGVQDFLFQYRSTPHTVTLLSPAELLMGRRLRDNLHRFNLLVIRLVRQSGRLFSEKGMPRES